MTRICILTFGCSLNISDSEVMSGLLEKHKFKMVKTVDEADLVIVNSCTVKHATEAHFWNLLNKLKEKNKLVVIAGCIAQTDPEKLSEYSLIGTTQLTHIHEIVEETLSGNIVKLIAKELNPRLNLPKIRKNHIIEIIPICQGCLGNCTYCKTKAARFELISYNKEAIICQAKQAIKDGVKEIWLTAQDTAVYGKDFDSKTDTKNNTTAKCNLTIIDLLKELIALKGNFKIRLGMGNPDHIKLYIGQLIPILQNEKMFQFIHIPVQSGNNFILKDMNRKYTIEEFKEIITKLRISIPNITLATDIIVGYPGETDEQFEDSIKLLKEIKPDVLNRSKYCARPKTVAASLPQLPGSLIKDRSRKLSQVFDFIGYEHNKSWLKWQGEILIDEIGKEETESVVGRNFAYKPVVVENKDGKLKIGDVVKVKIFKVTKYDLRGEIIK
ncbi:tRNA (N(6)-L-threonylcarbamoyladenosine(37)-C(2))-methylthiotransferase [Candidatus Woesearchaeota archaeon]|nr:tRNA (N(6)-L-threonylcarbamoyladenosine(37)-C(2))-methylthiotransferase [Candidatus Woesearchaeota archaeon]